MKEPITISKQAPQQAGQDFAFLRTEGLKYIEQLASDLWTDYNTHDPGITILEALCYAITDLNQRIALPIADLLVSTDNSDGPNQLHFASAKNILPASPLTLLDYRKLFIDIPGVRNAWLQPASLSYFVDCKESRISRRRPPRRHPTSTIDIKGLYQVLVEMEEELARSRFRAIRDRIRSVYHDHRNLCEDLLPNGIQQVGRQDVMICTDIELESDADIETVKAQLFYNIQQYLTPPVRKYSLRQLLDKGRQPEDIFDGPALENGFIDTEELRASRLRKRIFTSDLIQLIMDTPGVKAIRKILLNYCSQEDRQSEQGAAWCLEVEKGHQPILCTDRSVFNFYKGYLPFVPDEEEVAVKLAALQQEEADQLAEISNSADDLPIPQGTDRQSGSYYSFQNDFPQAYGIGQAGLPPIPDEMYASRKARSRQLKAYLLFFDQVLANYFQQLGRLRDLLSADSSIRTSYFSQAVEGLKNMEELFEEADFANLNTLLANLTAEHQSQNGGSVYENRRHRMLDHLLAHFAEQFNEYVLVMYSMTRQKRSQAGILRDKTNFLKEYPHISINRYKAYDYYNNAIIDLEGNELEKKVWYDQSDIMMPIDQINVAGLAHRIARMSGIHNYKPRILSSIEYQIYEELDDDNQSEPRWRIIDTDNTKILLSSSMHYSTEAEAEQEMRTAVALARDFGNYQLLTADDGRFYFNIIDSSGEVVGRRIEFFQTEDLRMDAIDYLIEFLNEMFSEEGLFVVEHLMLRPRKPSDNFLPVCTEPDCTTCETIDPYSFRLQIILPGYTPRFRDMEFRKFMEALIRKEMPAHILPRICWISANQMARFERAYRAWLLYQSENPISSRRNDRSLNTLIDVLNDLYTIYPPGTLHDCEEGNDENPIVLGHTQIGDFSPEVPRPANDNDNPVNDDTE